MGTAILLVIGLLLGWLFQEARQAPEDPYQESH